MNIWALVPFKGAAGAKRRLQPALDEAEREGLVMAMVRDVLAALAESSALSGVLLVSRDGAATALAREFQVEVFADQADDLSGAVVEASIYSQTKCAASGTLFVPGDVPLIRPADVAAVLDGHRDVTLVPDANDVGTNAAASTPPNAFEYLFDGKSFKPHIAAAKRAGVDARVVRRHAFGLDVDTVAELAMVSDLAAATRTGAYLAASGIAERLRRRAPNPRAANAAPMRRSTSQSSRRPTADERTRSDDQPDR